MGITLPGLSRTFRSAIVLLFCVICGCSVPRAELGAYGSQFEAARGTSEDLILGAKNAAEAHANDSANPAPPVERAKRLMEQLDALDARLQALQVIAQYNDALTRLAAGEDAAAVKASLDSFSSALASFSVKSLSKLVGSVAPYGEFAAAAIAFIDNQIQAKRFAKAIEAGEKPVLKILEILSLDADNILNIEKDRIALRADPRKMEAQLLAISFTNLANSHPFSDPAISSRFNSLLANHNKLRKTIGSNLLAHAPRAGAASEQEEQALATLTTINSQMQVHVDAYTQLIGQVEPQVAVIREYKKVLASTQNALMQIRVAIESGRSAAVVVFIQDVYSLRQAFLAAREAKSK
jgi:hypothetical protein